MNRKTTLYMAMSLDGFIADIYGNVDWLGKQAEKSSDYNEFLESIDTIIMGESTYEQITKEFSPEKWPYEGIKTYVFSDKVAMSDKNVEFKCGNLLEFVEKIKQENGKDIWILGGASIVNQIFRQIDEYKITIAPILLGSGVRLFFNDNIKVPLDLININQNGQFVELHYNKTN